MLTSTAQFGNNLISYVPQKTYIIDENIEFNVTFGQKKDRIDNKILEEAYSLADINNKIFLIWTQILNSEKMDAIFQAVKFSEYLSLEPFIKTHNC